jgi:hypothetical protein
VITVGAVIALVLSTWITVGGSLNEAVDMPLPGLTYNCNSLDVLMTAGTNTTSVTTSDIRYEDIPVDHNGSNVTLTTGKSDGRR